MRIVAMNVRHRGSTALSRGPLINSVRLNLAHDLSKMTHPGVGGHLPGPASNLGLALVFAALTSADHM